MFSNYFKVGIKLIGSNLGSRCDFPIVFSSANRYVIFPYNFECIQVNWRIEITSPQGQSIVQSTSQQKVEFLLGMLMVGKHFF